MQVIKMKKYKIFQPVKSWGVKPVTWSVVCNPLDQYWKRDLKTKREAIDLAFLLQDAFRLGVETEEKESHARAQKIMDRLGI